MNRFLILAAACAISITACKKDKDNGGPGGNENGSPPEFSNVQKNNTIITTQDEFILKVDPATGAAEKIYDFGNYNDASGFDYYNGVIYIGDESKTVNAIDLNSKKAQWRLPFVEDKLTTGSEVQVRVKDGIVYTTGYEGIVAAVDPVAKKVLWAQATNPEFVSGGSRYFPGYLSVVGDKVLFGSSSSVFYDDADRNYVYVFERSTGKKLLSLTLPAETYVTGQVNISGNTLLIPMGDLVAVDMTNAQEKWRLPMPKLSRGSGTPIISGDKVLVQGATGTGVDGKLFCLNLSRGGKLWEVEGGMDMAGRYTPAVIDGKYVLGYYERGTSLNANGRPFLVSITDGKKYWENDDIGVDGNGTYANGRIYVFGLVLDGNANTRSGLISLDAVTGKIEWSNQEVNALSNSQPLVIAPNGVLHGPQFY